VRLILGMNYQQQLISSVYPVYFNYLHQINLNVFSTAKTFTRNSSLKERVYGGV